MSFPHMADDFCIDFELTQSNCANDNYQFDGSLRLPMVVNGI